MIKLNEILLEINQPANKGLEYEKNGKKYRYNDSTDSYEIVQEDFKDIFPEKNKWEKLSNRDKCEYKSNIYSLIHNAYVQVGYKKNSSIPNINAVCNLSKYDFWEGINLSDNQEINAVIFGKTLFGKKISGIGHDGEMISKYNIVLKLKDLLSKQGYWAECSGNLKNKLLKMNIPYIRTESEVKNIFPKSNIQWLGNGKYIRKLSKTKKSEIEMIFGHPILKTIN